MFNKNAEIFDCNSLYKDKSNNLWIGTNGTGLIKYDQSTEKVERFRNNPNDAGSISSDIITSIYEDHRQTLWIGTFMGGLNAFDGKSFKKFQLNETNPNSLSSKSVYSLTEDNDHNLWIATLGGDVYKRQGRMSLFQSQLHHTSIYYPASLQANTIKHYHRLRQEV